MVPTLVIANGAEQSQHLRTPEDMAAYLEAQGNMGQFFIVYMLLMSYPFIEDVNIPYSA